MILYILVFPPVDSDFVEVLGKSEPLIESEDLDVTLLLTCTILSIGFLITFSDIFVLFISVSFWYFTL